MIDLIKERLNELTVETWWDGYQYTEIRDKDYVANCIFDDFNNLILTRIKELETELNNEDSTYSEASCRFRIDELKNLIK